LTLRHETLLKDVSTSNYGGWIIRLQQQKFQFQSK